MHICLAHLVYSESVIWTCQLKLSQEDSILKSRCNSHCSYVVMFLITAQNPWLSSKVRNIFKWGKWWQILFSISMIKLLIQSDEEETKMAGILFCQVDYHNTTLLFTYLGFSSLSYKYVPGESSGPFFPLSTHSFFRMLALRNNMMSFRF